MKWFRRFTPAAVLFLTAVLCVTAAFADGSTLKLPEDVTVIEEEAFYGDVSLDRVILPLGIEAIGPRAFAGSSLHTINLPDSLYGEAIASDAFDGSELGQVIVNYTSSAAEWAREHQNSLGYEIIYDSGSNSVVSGAAYDVRATAATVPLIYSIDEETAEAGYRMGVAYSENPDDIRLNTDGTLACMEWTWGGESGVYRPANRALHDGWLDEMIPGHTYWYSGCIMDSESRVLFLEDSVRSFTTGSASGVSELRLGGAHGFAPAGHVKTPFRFTAPAAGWYTAAADKAMNEISVRRLDDSGCGRATDAPLLNFYAGANETVYVFTRNFTEDAEVWIEAAEVPEADQIVSEIDLSGESPTARVTLDISGDTARRDYGYGIEYCPVECFQDDNGNRFANDFFWKFGDYRIRSNETVETVLSALIPGATYYYRGFIDYCNGQPRLVEEAVHSFTAPDNTGEIPLLTLEEWSDIPADRDTLFRFTATETGWYAVQAEGMYYCSIFNPDGSVLRASNEMENQDRSAILVLGMESGETCYVGTNGAQNARIRITRDSSVFFRLSDEPRWVWENRYVCFTAPSEGWYNVKVGRTDLGGMRVFANLPLEENSFWYDFHDDIDTQSIHALQAGDTFYFITWYDMNGGEQTVSIEPVTPPEKDSIAVTAVQTGDTWADISLNFSVSAATQDLACQRWGYQVGIYFSDGEISFHNDGTFSIEETDALYTLEEAWTWDSRFSIEDHTDLTRRLSRLLPGMTYYYFAFIGDPQKGEFFAHTEPASFSTAQASSGIVPLEFGQSHVLSVPEGSSVYRFVPENTAIYAVVSSGLDDLEIRGYNGRWIAKDRNYDWNNRDYAYRQGFIGEAGVAYYIFVENHFDDVTLYVGSGEDELPLLTDQFTGWYDGRQVFRFTPDESGSYRFVFVASDQAGEGQLSFAEPEHMDDNSGWPRYGEGNEATRWLEAGQTVYPGCWFDNEWAWVSMTVSRVASE